MVGQLVAGAVVQSATKDEGLVNQLFKIIVIIALIATIALIAFSLFLAFNIFDALGGVIEGGVGFFSILTAPFRLIGAGSEFVFGSITAFGSSFFARR
jgi:hypothetical protein